MATVVQMPKLTDTMQEGVLRRWVKKVGDKVDAGDVLAEVETDKATMEMETFDRGVLLKTLIEEGKGVPPGTAIAIIGAQGEDISKVDVAGTGSGSGSGSRTGDGGSARSHFDQHEQPQREQPVAPEPAAPSGRIAASPLVRKMARERGIELATIRGSGPGGRIVERDLADSGAKPAAAPGPSPAARPRPATIAAEDRTVPLTPMRRTIARRMAETKPGVPHFYLTREIDAAPLAQLREELLRDQEVKVSLNDLVLRATALALRQMPALNATFTGDAIVEHGRVDLAFAVAIDDGLVTPVIRGADAKSLFDIALEARALSERAHARKLRPEEMAGGTFTVSNLGMFGVDSFSAVIQPGEAGAIAVGALVDKPRVAAGAVVAGRALSLTLSCDHRVVDGATGAKFLAVVADLLAHPLRLVL